jgi:hypothetical protein
MANKKLKIEEFENKIGKNVNVLLSEFIENNNIQREDILCINDTETAYKFEFGTAFRRTTILYYFQ